jgi:predicted nuclease of predicted toxin-antitoxin system
MIFLLDENFPKAAGEVLKKFGHECFDFRGTTSEGADDDQVVQMAKERKAVILTTDRDFYHTLQLQYPDHCGVVVVALKQPNRAAILKRMEWFIRNIPEDQWRGRSFQLRDKTWASKPPLEIANE